jgi:hypothetical protein
VVVESLETPAVVVEEGLAAEGMAGVEGAAAVRVAVPTVAATRAGEERSSSYTTLSPHLRTSLVSQQRRHRVA